MTEQEVYQRELELCAAIGIDVRHVNNVELGKDADPSMIPGSFGVVPKPDEILGRAHVEKGEDEKGKIVIQLRKGVEQPAQVLMHEMGHVLLGHIFGNVGVQNIQLQLSKGIPFQLAKLYDERETDTLARLVCVDIGIPPLDRPGLPLQWLLTPTQAAHPEKIMLMREILNEALKADSTKWTDALNQVKVYAAGQKIAA